MAASGVFSLGDTAITTAATYTGIAVANLDGILSMTAYLRFAWGSAGTSARAYVQTSLDQGSTWCDIACVLFGTAAEAAVLNFSALTPKTTQVNPTDGTLSDDTAIDGIIGTEVRLKIVTTGTYATQTVLSGRITVR